VPGHGSYFGIAPTVTLQRQGPSTRVKYVGTRFFPPGGDRHGERASGRLPAALPSLFSANRSQTAAGKTCRAWFLARGAGDGRRGGREGGPGEYKVNFVLLLIAELNIFWGRVQPVSRLLPLDGGHIAGRDLGSGSGAWFARVRHQPGPGPGRLP